MTRGLCALLLILGTAVSVHADLEQAQRATQEEIRQAVDELNRLRDRIEGERLPLAERHRQLQASVQALRLRRDQARDRARDRERQSLALREEVAQLQAQQDALRGALQNHRRSLETRIGVAETETLAAPLILLDESMRADDGVAGAAQALLEFCESWNRRRVGGLMFDGHCLDADGLEHAGRFAALGPLAWFTEGTGQPAGPVVQRTGSSRPSLAYAFDHPQAAAVVSLVKGAEAIVPVDVTGGDALQLASHRRTLADHLRAGGLIMLPLLGIGLLALLLAIWKILTLHTVRITSPDILDHLVTSIRAGDLDDARTRVASLGEPMSTVLLAGIEHRAAPREHLEEIMHERALAAIPRLDRHLGLLAVLGGVAPLLGLLGTVTGMIHTFQLVTVFGTGDPGLLSGGISEALVTTETGLVIAVPVLLIHALLTRRVRTIVAALEQTVIGYMNRLQAAETGPS